MPNIINIVRNIIHHSEVCLTMMLLVMGIIVNEVFKFVVATLEYIGLSLCNISTIIPKGVILNICKNLFTPLNKTQKISNYLTCDTLSLMLLPLYTYTLSSLNR